MVHRLVRRLSPKSFPRSGQLVLSISRPQTFLAEMKGCPMAATVLFGLARCGGKVGKIGSESRQSRVRAFTAKPTATRSRKTSKEAR